VKDVKDIQRLVNSHAEKGEMLPRSLGDTCDSIRDFFVYEDNGVVLGCCALHVTWVDLAEIKSLAVADESQGKGMGRKLLDACLEDAQRLAIKRVFALTYKSEFFQKMGFQQIEKGELPHKVWLECVKCVKFPDCDEVAVIRVL
jgi:amino-acid N-acetyltransferase